MNRRNVVRLALAAALFGAAIPAASQAQTVLVQAKWWTPNQQSQRYQDRFHRDMFEGRWLAQDRFDTDIRFPEDRSEPSHGHDRRSPKQPDPADRDR